MNHDRTEGESHPTADECVYAIEWWGIMLAIAILCALVWGACEVLT